MYTKQLTTKKGHTFTVNSPRPFEEMAVECLLSAHRSLNKIARFNGKAQVAKGTKQIAKV